MESFIEEVVQEIKSKYESFEDLVFVLPSKRAGSFLRNHLAKNTKTTFFAPEIFSTESFVEKISGLAYANATQQLFVLYEAYLKQNPEPRDSFYAFSKWGQTLLQDFNEIDRYLIDAGKLFANLSAIQEVEHWSLQPQKTQMMQDYLRFWDNLEALYIDFNTALLQQGLGHQGLVYRTAVENLDVYLERHLGKTYIFMGFNALNAAESQLVQRILATGTSEIYWDIDTYFLEDTVHDAGHFIRDYAKHWEYLKEHGLAGTSGHYRAKKDIRIIGVPKNVSQAKYTARILEQINSDGAQKLGNTAVVLGDETLLNPLLNSVPETIDRVNITMGYPLESTPLASFFDQFLDLYIQRSEQGWFYRDFLRFMAHPNIHSLLGDLVSQIVTTVKKRNWTYIDADMLKGITANKGNAITTSDPVERRETIGVKDEQAPAAINDEALSLLFQNRTPGAKAMVRSILKIIALLKEALQSTENALSLEYLYRFYELFNQLDSLIGEHDFITDLKSLRSLFRQLLSMETLDFQGEPLEGLQIMGMLESRNLDFKTVIITSVNEGILPSGKSNNSYIPFDLKVHFGLPTYKEKDAVYTYHFYRLLQRAEQVYILYSTEPDDVLGGGERSRLIDQLLTDENRRGDIVEIHASPTVEPSPRTLERVDKDAGLLELIKAHATKGFSPTSLSNYIRNPMDFYKRNLLGVDDVEEVEENVAASTFGTVVHDTLEDLYRPFLGQILTVEHLKKAHGTIQERVNHHFLRNYGGGDISKGKNLIAFHVIVRYIEQFITMETEAVKQHRIKILSLEEKFKIDLEVPEVAFPVSLTGKLDRIDEVDGVVRIIDYKTGRVENKNVEITDWEALVTDYDHSKAFQLLCYSLMYTTDGPTLDLEAGIVSFKNLSNGLMRFATKPTSGSRTKDHTITRETLVLFTSELYKLISEICDPGLPFTEKEI